MFLHKAGALSAVLSAINQCDQFLDHRRQRVELAGDNQHGLAPVATQQLVRRNESTPVTITEDPRGSMATAIALPILFAAVLFILIAVACILPRLSPPSTPETREERRKRRLNSLDESVKAQMFKDWWSKEALEHPEGTLTPHPVCVICLDTIDDQAPIRGLHCLHVFHQACLDDWFARWNEFCPLCHRPILPSQAVTAKDKKGRAADAIPPPEAIVERERERQQRQNMGALRIALMV